MQHNVALIPKPFRDPQNDFQMFFFFSKIRIWGSSCIVVMIFNRECQMIISNNQELVKFLNFLMLYYVNSTVILFNIGHFSYSFTPLCILWIVFKQNREKVKINVVYCTHIENGWYTQWAFNRKGGKSSGPEEREGEKMINILLYIGCTYSSRGGVIFHQNIRADDRGA